MNRTKLKVTFFIFIFLFFFFNNANINGYAFENRGRIIPIDIVGPLTIVISFLYLHVNKLKFYISKNIRNMLFLFIGVLFITALMRDNIIASLRNFTAILITYIVVVALSTILHNIAFDKVLKVLIYTISLIILPFNLYIQQVKLGGFAIMPDRLAGEDILRFGGALYHAHNGMILGITFLLLMYLLIIRNKIKILYIILSIVILISIILTDCRSVWGGIIICTFLMVYSKIKSNFKKIVFISISSMILILGLLNLINKSTTIGNTKSDAGFRELIWISGINGVLNEPLKGYGNLNYFKTNPNSRLGIADSLIDSHNSFLDLFLQNGIPASIILILLYYKIFKEFKKTRTGYELYVLLVFWIFVPFFWGSIYNGTTSFITFFFPLVFFSIFLHPELRMPYSYNNILSNTKKAVYN